MELTEIFVEMSQAERGKLRKLTRSAPVLLLIQAFFSAGVLWLVLDNSEASRVFNAVFILIFVVSFSASGYKLYKTNTAIYKDLKSGKKKVMIGLVESKREESSGYSSTYYLTIQQQEFVVSFSRWQSVEVNQPIELHIAVCSKHIFGVYSIENE